MLGCTEQVTTDRPGVMTGWMYGHVHPLQWERGGGWGACPACQRPHRLDRRPGASQVEGFLVDAAMHCWKKAVQCASQQHAGFFSGLAGRLHAPQAGRASQLGWAAAPKGHPDEKRWPHPSQAEHVVSLVSPWLHHKTCIVKGQHRTITGILPNVLGGSGNAGPRRGRWKEKGWQRLDARLKCLVPPMKLPTYSPVMSLGLNFSLPPDDEQLPCIDWLRPLPACCITCMAKPWIPRKTV